MITYKLFRVKNEKLHPLYVETKRNMEIGKWLKAEVGEKVDDTHVKSALGKLALRPGFHSTTIPFTDWIGKRMPDGTLAQKQDTVWCECEIKGNEIEITERYGLREVPNGWYYFKTNAKQEHPWIISKWLKINKVLTHEEVEMICELNGKKAQKIA